ncbi:MAG: CxxxxCH/CxxCH domain-containing protein [Desulfobulbaceae bacterium]|nr:CxxxxCH/CxxCH domain-containing protein [Desulfobulbaceae bacterium]
MRKTILCKWLMVGFIVAPALAFADAGMAPHNTGNLMRGYIPLTYPDGTSGSTGSEYCWNCHNVTVDGNVVYVSRCETCHSNTIGGYGNMNNWDKWHDFVPDSAPKMMTHRNLACGDCHYTVTHGDMSRVWNNKLVSGTFDGNSVVNTLIETTAWQPNPDYWKDANGDPANPVIEEQYLSTITIPAGYTVLHPDWSDPADWMEKTGPERGLILGILNSNDAFDNEIGNFEVTETVVNGDGSLTLTVKGKIILAGLNGVDPVSPAFGLYYYQMLKPDVGYCDDPNLPGLQIDTANPQICFHYMGVNKYGSSNCPDNVECIPQQVNFAGPSDFAKDDGLGVGGIDSTPDGICQVCHLSARHWRRDGSLGDHYNGQRCTDCHEHTKGFQAPCVSCHAEPPMDTAGMVYSIDGMNTTPGVTGSTTFGAHAIHASTSGHNFSCDSCHTGGMPDSSYSGNNAIQIGFALNPAGFASTYDGQSNLTPPFIYEGTSGNIITTGGSLACSNIYCHSDGTAVSASFFDPSVYFPPGNSTPPWNGQWNDSDGTTCNNCHQYPPQYSQDDPKANTHLRHMQAGYTCQHCHYATTQDDVSVDSAMHANGVYDVVSGPSFSAHGEEQPLSFDYVFDPGGGTCSSNACHNYWGLSKERWGNASISASANIQQNGTLCGDVTFNINVTGGYPNSPVPPYTCYYEWGDGAITDWSDDCSASHVYDTEGNHDVTWSVRDARMHTLSGTAATKTTPVNVSYTPGCIDPASIDSDGDGMTDVWENLYGLDYLDPTDAGLDPDKDGLTSLYEFNLNTDPTLADTDGDGVDDGHDGYPLDNGQSVCSDVILGNGIAYASVSAAYGQIQSGDTIQLAASDLSENLLFDQNIVFTLSGGYECSFINNPVNTEVSGSLIIADGTLTVDMITIK